ncbi:MAG: cyclic nucleotide-binding/CBS domain-containing protein [Maricaulaceae bacterium]
MPLKSLVSLHDYPLVTCLPEEFLDEIVDHMIESERNAVLVQEPGNKTVGILTDHDLLRALHSCQTKAGKLENEQARDWMTEQVIMTDVSTKLGEALRLLGKYQIHHLVLTDKGLPVGVVNIRDILTKIHDDDVLEMNVLRDMAIFSHGAAA